ncbi:MAG: phosphotransferase family protein, partial [Candidatus Puniceispirillaceae bacterium]
IGRKFFVMEKIDGVTVFDPTLAAYAAPDRTRLYHHQVDILAALAELDPAAIGLADFGRPAGYLDRQFATWTRQYRASQTDDLADMEFLMAYLGDALNADLPGQCVIHGDFRLDNMLLQNGIHIQALIDWELSTLGPAFIDLSYWCAMLRMQHDWPIGGLGGVDRTQLGIPPEADLVRQFCTRTGLHKPANWEALIAFQCFRFAAILQGVRKRQRDGNASASNAAAVGSQAAPMATLGADILRVHLATR